MVVKPLVFQFSGNRARNLKSTSCYARQIWNPSPDYSLNCTSLSPITTAYEFSTTTLRSTTVSLYDRSIIITSTYWSLFTDFSSLQNKYKRQHDHAVGKGVFWVYGDSLSYYFYESLNFPMSQSLCFKIFEKCNNTYNWIYPKTLYELVSFWLICSRIQASPNTRIFWRWIRVIVFIIFHIAFLAPGTERFHTLHRQKCFLTVLVANVSVFSARLFCSYACPFTEAKHSSVNISSPAVNFTPLIFVFSAQTETCAEVNLQVPRVLGFFRQVLLRKDMDKDSALLLNAGAHYVKVFMSSFNFQSSLLLMTMMRIL